MFSLGPDRALVATVDFFTPIVDNPAAWGAIAVANALSDIYAMGATPLFGLNLVGWPREAALRDVLGEVLRGAAEVAKRAGCLILGGHSIDSAEPTFGMAVIGEVHPDRMLTNAGACAGDLLVLTKPLGTGILATALKRDALLETGMADAVRSMTTLNDGASRAALKVGVSAATDVTGFGLIGHLTGMLEASKVAAEIAFEALPILPHAKNLASRGVVPGGTQRNLEAATNVDWAPELSPADRYICVDAQTSGGLLLAVPAENEAALLAALKEERTPAAVGYRPSGCRAGRDRSGDASRPDRKCHPLSVLGSQCPIRWTAQRMDQLENAARRGLRVALSRRGTEYIVVAQRVTTVEQHDALVGWLPMTGEELTFRLEDIESFQVIE